MSEILIKFINKSMVLPRNYLDLKDIMLIFNVKEAGLHLKVNDGAAWINVWPQTNGFISEGSLPPNCTEALLIAMENNQISTSSVVTNSNNIDSTITTSTSTNYYNGRRGNSATTTNGPRALQNTYKRKFECSKSIPLPLRKKSSSNFMKNITVTHITENSTMETIFDVPVNITELAQKCSSLTVDDIQDEVKSQIGGSIYYIITDKKGNPIRNMKNTRGAENWTNKTFVRAIPAEQYKSWRPEVYRLTKKDYSQSFLDDSDDDDLEDFDFPSILHPVVNTFEPQSSPLSQANPPFSIPPVADPSVVSPSAELETLTKIKDCFKCTICFEVKFALMFCASCARNIGCPSCIGELDQCPLCRAKFEFTCPECSNVSNTLPTPVKIAGIEELL